MTKTQGQNLKNKQNPIITRGRMRETGKKSPRLKVSEKLSGQVAENRFKLEASVWWSEQNKQHQKKGMKN